MGVATTVLAGRSRDRIPLGEIFVYSKVSRLVLGLTQPPVQWIAAFCPRGKLDGREVNR